MTSNLDVVKKWINEAWANPPSSVFEANKTYFADNFKSYDKDGTVVMDKEAYLGMGHLLSDAFKDFKWLPSGFREEGDSVIMTGHFEGTQTGNLDLSAMHAGVIPASGKKIVWPEASVKYEVKGNKIVSEKPYGGSAGIEGFLKPLGVKMPKS